MQTEPTSKRRNFDEAFKRDAVAAGKSAWPGSINAMRNRFPRTEAEVFGGKLGFIAHHQLRLERELMIDVWLRHAAESSHSRHGSMAVRLR